MKRRTPIDLNLRDDPDLISAAGQFYPHPLTFPVGYSLACMSQDGQFWPTVVRRSLNKKCDKGCHYIYSGPTVYKSNDPRDPHHVQWACNLAHRKYTRAYLEQQFPFVKIRKRKLSSQTAASLMPKILETLQAHLESRGFQTSTDIGVYTFKQKSKVMTVTPLKRFCWVETGEIYRLAQGYDYSGHYNSHYAGQFFCSSVVHRVNKEHQGEEGHVEDNKDDNKKTKDKKQKQVMGHTVVALIELESSKFNVDDDTFLLMKAILHYTAVHQFLLRSPVEWKPFLAELCSGEIRYVKGMAPISPFLIVQGKEGDQLVARRDVACFWKIPEEMVAKPQQSIDWQNLDRSLLKVSFGHALKNAKYEKGEM